MTTQRIVTAPMGAWKWQAAYRVATYAARPDQSGIIRWWSASWSGKYSEPQLRRAGLWDQLPHGSIHRRALTAEEIAQGAAHRMGAREVQP